MVYIVFILKVTPCKLNSMNTHTCVYIINVCMYVGVHTYSTGTYTDVQITDPVVMTYNTNFYFVTKFPTISLKLAGETVYVLKRTE